MLADIWQIRGRDENLYFIPKDKHVCTNVISDFVFGVHHYEGQLNTCSFHELDCFFFHEHLYHPFHLPVCWLISHTFSHTQLCHCVWTIWHICGDICIHVYACVYMYSHVQTHVYTQSMNRKRGIVFWKLSTIKWPKN